MDIDVERLVWIKVRGIPCHAWGESLFSLIAESICIYVRCDEGTLLKTRMEEARIFVCTKKMERVVDFILLKVGELSFSIRLVEDDSFILAKLPSSRLDEEIASESLSDSNEEASRMEEHGEELQRKDGREDEDDVDGTGGDGVYEVEKSLGTSKNNSLKIGEYLAKTLKEPFNFVKEGNRENSKKPITGELIVEQGRIDDNRVEETIFSTTKPSQKESGPLGGNKSNRLDGNMDHSIGPISFDQICRDVSNQVSCKPTCVLP